MKVLFEMVNPADVHFFKHVIHRLMERGDHILVASRKKRTLLWTYWMNSASPITPSVKWVRVPSVCSLSCSLATTVPEIDIGP